MKITAITTMIFLLLLASCYYVIADEMVYACKVIHVYDLDDNGNLRTSNLEKQFKNSEFYVSRVTGEIIGAVVPTLFARSTKIINKGSNEYSFKAMAEFDNQVQLIEIQEFLQKDIKPFIAISMGGAGIITGVCK